MSNALEYAAVVSPSKSTCALLEEFLQKLGVKTQSLPDLESARKLLSNIEVQLVIYDSDQPERDIDLIHSLRNMPSLERVPFLALIDEVQAPSLLELARAGTDAFVEKKDIQRTLPAQIICLSRKQRVGDLDELKTKLGQLKHELGNALTTIDGKCLRLERSSPEFAANETFQQLRQDFERVKNVARKCGELI
jgi:DNA-binding response OmpR family regulator